jgi:hypothetical protein
MTRRLALLALAAAVTVSLAAAHPGHDHKVMGTIDTIDGMHVVLKTTDGKEISFEITDDTRLVRGTDGEGAIADLRAGLRVVVNVGEGVEPIKAKEIQYAAPTSR